jgi:hypothetical protein
MTMTADEALAEISKVVELLKATGQEAPIRHTRPYIKGSPAIAAGDFRRDGAEGVLFDQIQRMEKRGSQDLTV